jgi:hypothetical protein
MSIGIFLELVHDPFIFRGTLGSTNNGFLGF